MQTKAAKPPPAEARPFQRILLPIEGSDREFVVQQAAVHLAAAMQVPLVALHVAADQPEVGAKTFRFVETEAKKWGVGLQARAVLETDPVQGIIDEAGPLDLIIMGTQRMGSRYRLGSVVAQLLEQAPCPIMVVRLPK